MTKARSDAEFIHLWESGVNVNIMAKYFDCVPGTIYRWVQDMGLKPRSVRKPRAQKPTVTLIGHDGNTKQKQTTAERWLAELFGNLFPKPATQDDFTLSPPQPVDNGKLHAFSVDGVAIVEDHTGYRLGWRLPIRMALRDAMRRSDTSANSGKTTLWKLDGRRKAYAGIDDLPCPVCTRQGIRRTVQ